MQNDIILRLYSLPQTVFTLQELSLLFPAISYTNLKNRIHYFARTGKLRAVRRGLFVKSDYDLYELANKLYTPSYISLETVLQKEGIIFQVYETVSVISYLSRTIWVDGHSIRYHQVKDSVLTETSGLENKNTYFIASKERAFLDAVFLYKNYHFDNLLPLNWDEVERLKGLYYSPALEKRVKNYHTYFKEQYAQ
jgi:hypothetical protein